MSTLEWIHVERCITCDATVALFHLWHNDGHSAPLSDTIHFCKLINTCTLGLGMRERERGERGGERMGEREIDRVRQRDGETETETDTNRPRGRERGMEIDRKTDWRRRHRGRNREGEGAERDG